MIYNGRLGGGAAALLMDDPERRRTTINHVFESLTEIKEGEKKQWH